MRLPVIIINDCWEYIIEIEIMHESAIGGHDQWLPRCRSNIGIGNEIVGSFLVVLNSIALYAIWNMLCNLISE